MESTGAVRLSGLVFFTVTLTLVLWLAPSASRAQIPETIRFHGVVEELAGGPPANGTYDFAVDFYDAAVGGQVVYSSIVAAEIMAGAYALSITPGQTGELVEALFGGARFVELTVLSGPHPGGPAIGQSLLPRQGIASAPFAIAAERTRLADTANSLADPSGIVPAGAIVLWDSPVGCDGLPDTCPCGYTAERLFDAVTIRGAAPSSAVVPDAAGVRCDDTSGCGGEPGERFDDRLDLAELALHGHPVRIYGDYGGWNPDVAGGFATGHFPGAHGAGSYSAHDGPPGDLDGTQIGGTGGNASHFHPFRTVLFCRRG